MHTLYSPSKTVPELFASTCLYHTPAPDAVWTGGLRHLKKLSTPRHRPPAFQLPERIEKQRADNMAGFRSTHLERVAYIGCALRSISLVSTSLAGLCLFLLITKSLQGIQGWSHFFKACVSRTCLRGKYLASVVYPAVADTWS